MTSKCKMLHDLIHSPKLLVMPGAYDALSAKLVEKTGFSACQVSGFGVAASMFGLPDVGIVSVRDQVNVTQWISQAVDIPVMSDGDTGYGNAVNTFYTVKQLEAAGAAGVNLEDQVYPKRCGHMDGKDVIPKDEMVKKIKAACQAKVNPYFVVHARTDALATHGIEEAVRRGNAYAEAGASCIFIEAPTSKEQIEYVVKHINAPISINLLGTPGGKTPQIPLADLEAIGVARVSFPLVTICTAAKSIEENLGYLKEHGTIKGMEEKLTNFSEITDLVGLGFVKKLHKEL